MALPELATYDVGRTLQFAQAGQKQRTLADLGRLAAGGDYKGAQAAAFAGGETALGLQLKQMNDADKQQLVNEAASWAYSADTPEKWAQGQSYWAGKGFDVGPFERRDATIAAALSVKDKMDQAYRTAQLAASNKPTPYTDPAKAKLDLDRGLITQQQYDEIIGGGGDLFPGNSPEAAALNELIKHYGLTKEQAAQWAAGKVIQTPDGTFFLPPSSVFGSQGGGSAGGGGVTPPPSPGVSGAPPGGAAGATAPPPLPVPGGPATATAVGTLTPPAPAATTAATPAGGTAAGGPIQLAKPRPSDAQLTTATFADRMTAANPIIEKFEKAGLDWTQPLINQVPLFGGGFTSADWQQLDQAERDFLNAVLRRESGAVISPTEFADGAKQYFPQPGNGPDVLKQKARNRQLVTEGTARAAGPAYQPRSAAPVRAGTPVPPTGFNDAGQAPKKWLDGGNTQEQWRYVPPEQRDAFR